MTRHCSKPNKLRNVNPLRGRTGNVTIQKWKIYYIKIIALIINLDETNPFEIDKCKSKNPMVLSYQTYYFCPNLWIWQAKFEKKIYKKIFSSEAIRGIKLKLSRMFITLAFTEMAFFFIVVVHVLSLLWHFKVSIDLQWEKWKFTSSLPMFWQKFYRNVPWVVLYETYCLCPNVWIWLVAMASEIFKNLLRRSRTGDKAKTCKNVHNISL